MNNVEPILNRSITIEFFLDDHKKLNLVYNKKRYTFSEFWTTVQDAEKISRYILEQFKYQYPDRYQRARVSSKDWKEIFVKIINNHLRALDNKLDVFIRNSGDVVFHLEY